MSWWLKAPAHGPDGDYVDAGRRAPNEWPAWFIEDLKTLGHLEERPDEAGDDVPVPGEPLALEGTSDRGREGTG